MSTQPITQEFEIHPGVDRLTKDLRKASYSMTLPEARYLVDSYYSMQRGRIRSANQVRALSATGEPHEVLAWLGENNCALEEEIGKALDVYTKSYKLGLWVRSITGIGPVIAAGLLAHINIEKAPTVGHIWRYAGLDPTVTWNKRQLRPWNAQLKTLCWKIGQSFLKQINRESDFYGKVLMQRRQYEAEKNARGDYKEQALALVARVPNHAQATIYKQGKLPDGHILARAERYAVKLFLAHFHHVAYELRFGTLPPKPYIIEHGGHAHYISPPNWPLQLSKKQQELPGLPTHIPTNRESTIASE